MSDIASLQEDAPEDDGEGETSLTTRGTPRLRAVRPGEGRQPFVPTDAQRDLVEVWRGTGIAPEDIARQIGISLHTLRKYFPDEMAHGQTTLISKIGGKVVAEALSGNFQAMKFYLANFGEGRWTEKSKVEHSGSDGGPLAIEIIRRIIVDPEPLE